MVKYDTWAICTLNDRYDMMSCLGAAFKPRVQFSVTYLGKTIHVHQFNRLT